MDDNLPRSERPPAPSTSEAGLPSSENGRETTSNDDAKWARLMEQQNRNFMALIEAMKLPSSNKEIRLPEFNPDKDNADARAWVTTADMCITDPNLQGALLMMSLSRALRGEASAWLSQVAFHGMTWTNFKDLFTARYECAETPAAFLINLHNGRPKDNECLASYAATLMSSIMSKWKNLTMEQIAISTVLMHISQFNERAQKLAFTQDVATRSRLQQELTAISFMKRKSSYPNEHILEVKRPRLSTEAPTTKCFNCGKVGHKAIQCRLRKGPANQDARPKTPLGDVAPWKPSSVPSVTCFNCGAVGHFAKNCPRRSSKEDSTSSSAGPSQEKRVNVCTVSTPTGMLRHAVSRNAAPSLAQIEKLVELLEARTWLATGHARSANARNRTRQAWIDIETTLNSEGSGCVKTWQQWCKYWKDKKGAVKRKASALAVARRRTGGGVEDVAELSEIELRIINLMGGESFAVGDRHLEINPFQDQLPFDSAAAGSSTASESVLNINPENDVFQPQRSEQIDNNETPHLDLPEELDINFQNPGPSIQTGTQSVTAGEQLMVTQRRVTPLPSAHADLNELNQPSSPVNQQRRPVRRRILQSSPAGSARQQRTVLSPITSARRRLLRRSPPSQNRSHMTSLVEKFIAIEERRAEAEVINARANEACAHGQQALADAVTRIASSWSEHAQALNVLSATMAQAIMDNANSTP